MEIRDIASKLAAIKIVKQISDAIGWHPLRNIAWKERFNYEPAVRETINKIVKKGWTCVDVGSNIGIVTDMLAVQAGPTGQVVAFEAFKKNAEQLAKYLSKEIKAGYVKVNNLAVSDGSSDHLWLYPGRNSAAGEWNIKGHDLNGADTQARFKVASISLDGFFSSDFKVDFIKIDVEGAGDMVLEGAKKIITKFHPVVLMEFHNAEEWEARKMLLARGYHFFHLDGSVIPDEGDLERVYLCYALPQSFKRQ